MNWTDVNDRLPPESGTLCIVALDTGDNGAEETYPALADFHHGQWEIYDRVMGPGAKVTHWIPFDRALPPMPKVHVK